MRARELQLNTLATYHGESVTPNLKILSKCFLFVVFFFFAGGPTLSFDRFGNERPFVQNALQPDAKLPSNMFASDEKPEENEWSRSELLACILISVACGHGCGGCRRNRQKNSVPLNSRSLMELLQPRGLAFVKFDEDLGLCHPDSWTVEACWVGKWGKGAPSRCPAPGSAVR